MEVTNHHVIVWFFFFFFFDIAALKICCLYCLLSYYILLFILTEASYVFMNQIKKALRVTESTTYPVHSEAIYGGRQCNGDLAIAGQGMMKVSDYHHRMYYYTILP